MSTAALYVYGILDADHPCHLSTPDGVGGVDARPRRIEFGSLAAVVSEAPRRIRAKRRDVEKHHRVLTELLGQGAVLPMRFGVVARDEAALRDDLDSNQDHYEALLAELRGHVEFNVKMEVDEDEMLREIAVTDPTVRRLRGRRSDAFAGKLELGQAVATAMDVRQQAAARKALDHLLPLSARCTTAPRVQGCAWNTALLVPQDRADRLPTTVEELNSDFGGRLRFSAKGPLPPYSFVSNMER